MKEAFQAVKITDRVYWVGAVDWNIKDFHGYATSRGTTYNAFLVLADKITLIDTVKASFRDEMMTRIASVIDPGDISVIISNHAEMDHSGCLPETIERVDPEHVYASKMGVRALQSHFNRDCRLTGVADGSTVSLGDMKLSFYETRMLHWPDSMFTWLHEEGVLFSQDAFGMHLASTERFTDEIEPYILEREAGKYFANILLPYARLIPRLADRLGKLGLDIRIMAPDHGPVYRREKDIAWIVDMFLKWAEQKPSRNAVIVYDTMWGSTDTMACAIAEGLRSGGCESKVMSLDSYHRSDVATEMLDAGALIAGSPTLNNNIFPTVADVMVYLKGLKPKNLVGAAFGSYGWSGEAINQLETLLDEMNVERVADSLKTEYVPEKDDLLRCFELGKTIAGKLKEMC